MCTLTLILPLDFPKHELFDLREPGLQRDCFLGEDKLVWHNKGYYFLFSCQPRQLILNAVSDFNPLIGSSPQPLGEALSKVAMDEVDRLIVKHKKYKVQTNTGNVLRKELRQNLEKVFFFSRNAVKNYFGPLPIKAIDESYRELIALAEQAIINPKKLFLLASESGHSSSKTLILIGSNGASFKCRLSESWLRISQASAPGSFSIHQFRNNEIRITAHCLERFTTRILGQSLDNFNPVLAESALLKFIKNKAVSYSFLMRKTAFIDVSGYIFIGAVSRGRLNLVTTYKETLVETKDFHRQVLALLQGAQREEKTKPA